MVRGGSCLQDGAVVIYPEFSVVVNLDMPKMRHQLLMFAALKIFICCPLSCHHNHPYYRPSSFTVINGTLLHSVLAEFFKCKAKYTKLYYSLRMALLSSSEW